jgi:hypothetical protein
MIKIEQVLAEGDNMEAPEEFNLPSLKRERKSTLK